MFTEQKSSPYVVLKSRYGDCVCPECKSIDHDKAFAKGFDADIKIRAKGDMLCTSEGFICFSERVLTVIESAGFSGITLKPIPESAWYVVNSACRLNADQTAYKMTKPFCNQCGRPKECIGLIRCLNQIDVPRERGTFFSPVFDRGGSMNGDRDLFATEDIVTCFKQQGIKGGMFARLLTPPEFEKIKAAGLEKNLPKWPKDSRVIL